MTVHIETVDGRVERFIMGSNQESAEVIDQAIRAARNLHLC